MTLSRGAGAVAPMRWVDHGAGGGPEVLRIVEGPSPAPGAGEVVVAVEWAGVNRPDLLQRAGHYPPPPGASAVLGLEIAGTVVETGPGVEWPLVGMSVCALAPGGGYAERCVVPAAHCLPIPAGLTTREAAALPETAFTVWDNVVTRGRLRAGETILVHGGSGGIGLMAIQVARALGARVVATAGTPAKVRLCEEMGASAGIDYRTQDFEAEVAKLTAWRGVDVVLDVVGGDYVAKNLRSLAMEGRLVQIAFQQRSVVELDLRVVMQRRLTITGSTLRPRTVDEKAAVARLVRERLWPLVEAGQVRPLVTAEFPLEEAAAAHRLLESGDSTGKIVLRVGGGA